MSLNPDSLTQESDWERLERQRITGVLGNGTHVTCHPDMYDPSILQIQHRAVCALRPLPTCGTCPHNSFTLIFRAQPLDPYERLACPRWGNERTRLSGAAPDTYVIVERALCSTRPFTFCNSCPPKDALEDVGADKVIPGWYGRWRRIMEDYAVEEDEDRG